MVHQSLKIKMRGSDMGESETIWGEHLFHFEEIESTNKKAFEYAMLGVPTGTVVLADSQHGAYGRMGREWSAPKGGLWFSIILNQEKIMPALPLLFGLWNAQFISSQLGVDCKLHWPNDLYVSGRKLAGILIESNVDCSGKGFSIVGIGINLLNRSAELDPEYNAISISDLTDEPLSRDWFLEDLLMHLQLNYETAVSRGFLFFRDDIEELCPFIGNRVNVLSDGNIERIVTVNGIGDKGQLLITEENGKSGELWNCIKVRPI